MARIQINATRCKGCALCTTLCPEGLIEMGKQINENGYFFAVFNKDNGTCKGCALCAKICPDVAIEVWK